MNPTIAVVDLGGQYCHLITRRLQDLGVDTVILTPNTLPPSFDAYSGIVLSGGPSSVYDPSAPVVRDDLFQSRKPILGICYGHQLLVHKLGGSVERGQGEYGHSTLALAEADTLFAGLPAQQRVWMSHADSVTQLPKGAIRLAGTPTCENAAFAMPAAGFYGVQFHPEVVHSEFGDAILRNFVERVCGITQRIAPSPRVPGLVDKIRKQAGNKSVFFLVSGGVDSTVAFVLCARALPKERVLGLYVDTGLMRKGETDELRQNLNSLGLESRFHVRDESKRFLGALRGVSDPEKKREIIGRAFVDVQSDAMHEYGIDAEHWLLGQGTIYPDTIESGGSTGQAAKIKTHHNRCQEILDLIEQGRVIEPLAEFYKDQVRAIGIELDWHPSSRTAGRSPVRGWRSGASATTVEVPRPCARSIGCRRSGTRSSRATGCRSAASVCRETGGRIAARPRSWASSTTMRSRS